MHLRSEHCRAVEARLQIPPAMCPFSPSALRIISQVCVLLIQQVCEDEKRSSVSLRSLWDSDSLLCTLFIHVAFYHNVGYKRFKGFTLSWAETLCASTSITYTPWCEAEVSSNHSLFKWSHLTFQPVFYVDFAELYSRLNSALHEKKQTFLISI